MIWVGECCDVCGENCIMYVNILIACVEVARGTSTRSSTWT